MTSLALLRSITDIARQLRLRDRRHSVSNQYEISIELPGKLGGVHREIVDAASETDARNLVRARYGTENVRVVAGRQVRFGGGSDDRDRR